jgi:hypothetical protein
MGVGTPEDILQTVARGVDMFDCVMPTRNGRHAGDPRPLAEESTWPSTHDYSRAYLHHLVRSGETPGAILLSEINKVYYQRLMHDIREAIAAGTFESFRDRPTSNPSLAEGAKLLTLGKKTCAIAGNGVSFKIIQAAACCGAISQSLMWECPTRAHQDAGVPGAARRSRTMSAGLEKQDDREVKFRNRGVIDEQDSGPIHPC